MLSTTDVTVVDIFGTSAWSKNEDLTDPADITRLRQEEERRALARADCALVLHEYPEALLRGYTAWNAPLHESDEGLSREISETLRADLETATHVYFPLAVGDHVDHLIVAQQAETLLPELHARDVKVYLYEDLPYARYGGVEEALERAREVFSLEPFEIDISDVIDKKICILGEYSSQLGDADLVKVREFSHEKNKLRKNVERIWKLKSQSPR